MPRPQHKGTERYVVLEVLGTFCRGILEFSPRGPVVEQISPVNLATEPDFEVGALFLSPSACRVRSGGHEQRIEPRVMQVLVVLARRPQQTVSRDQLIEACWNGRVVSDDAVNRVVAQLRTLARSFEPSPYQLETVAKVGFRFVPAPLRSDVTEGLADEAPIPSQPAVVAPSPRLNLRWAAAAAIVLIAAVVWILWRPRTNVTTSPDQNGRVEVVNFDVRQNDPELRGLTADLGDALIRNLSRSAIDTVPQLAVRGSGSNAADAELRVTGSVGRQGSDVIANVQILDRQTGLVLNSTQITRPQNALAGFADQVALGVAAVLSCALEDRHQSRRTIDPTILALYLNTCDAFIREGNVQRALENAQRLVKAAPDLAVAQAMLAIMQVHAAKQAEQPPAEAVVLRSEARRSAKLALKLDPQTPKAYIAIALSYPENSHWLEREQNLVKARQMDPTLGPGRLSYLELLREVGRTKDALQLAQLLADSPDPRIAGGPQPSMAFILAQSGDVEGAKNIAHALEQSDPETARNLKWQIASFWDAPATALKDLQALDKRRINPQSVSCTAQFLAELPQRIAARTRGLPVECASVPAFRRVLMLIREGDIDGAYAVVANGNIDAWILEYLYGRDAKAFWSDPRFMTFAARFDLPQYWRKSGQWPDICAEPDLRYDCRRVAQTLLASSRHPP